MAEGAQLHVVFGSGPVGLALVEELVARGRRVRVLNRSGRAEAPEGVEFVGGDASDVGFTRRACEGAEVVYQCLNPPYDRWPELFPALQDAVIEGAASADAKLVSMENVYMYGPPHGAPITEDMPYAATTKKGRVRADMAEQWEQAHRDGNVRATAARASDFYGPRALLTAVGERVFYPALNGKAAQVLGDPDQPHTYSYIPDIARGLAVLGERDEALGEAWHIPSADTLTTREFIARIAEAAGTDTGVRPLPKWLVPVVSLLNKPLRELKEMLYEFEEPFVLDHSKFEKAFGDIATPLDEAIPTTLDWFRTHPR